MVINKAEETFSRVRRIRNNRGRECNEITAIYRMVEKNLTNKGIVERSPRRQRIRHALI